MGLDMYLEGERYYRKNYDSDDRPKCNGYPVKQKVLDMGYWRKHPDLHGYIIQTYAEGIDECQGIYLDADELEDIANAIEKDKLAHGTEGFFFGNSEVHAMHLKEDAKIFRDAKKWLESFDDSERWCVSVKYQASW
jgi:hypothetical protein